MKRIVGDYGGNFYGYGSRNGSSYWPRDLIRIDGEALTYTFEVRSGREQHSPESVVWGFGFTVFPIFDTNPEEFEDVEEEEGPPLPRQTPAQLLKQQSLIERLTLISLDLVSCFTSKLSASGQPEPRESDLEAFFMIQTLHQYVLISIAIASVFICISTEIFPTNNFHSLKFAMAGERGSLEPPFRLS